MPVTLSPPIYGAARRGLLSKQSFTFSGDFSVYVPLIGTFQGDGVRAITMGINNYNNALPISYTVGGTTAFISAYTLAYIDVSDIDGILLQNTAPNSVDIFIYDHVVQGDIQRGNPPAGNFDPFWSSVSGLWHFIGTNGQTFAPDARNSGRVLGDKTKQFITTSNSIFQQGSCAFSDGTTIYNQGESLPVPTGIAWTAECAVSPVSTNAFNVCATFFSNVNSGGVPTGYCFAFRPDPGTSGNVRYEAWFVNAQGAGTLIAATGYTYPINNGIWHSLSLVANSTVTLYVDGVAIGNNAVPIFGIGSVYIFQYSALFPGATGPMLLAELRVTNAVRYTANYAAPAAPFPNQ